MVIYAATLHSNFQLSTLNFQLKKRATISRTASTEDIR